MESQYLLVIGSQSITIDETELPHIVNIVVTLPATKIILIWGITMVALVVVVVVAWQEFSL